MTRPWVSSGRVKEGGLVLGYPVEGSARPPNRPLGEDGPPPGACLRGLQPETEHETGTLHGPVLRRKQLAIAAAVPARQALETGPPRCDLRDRLPARTSPLQREHLGD